MILAKTILYNISFTVPLFISPFTFNFFRENHESSFVFSIDFVEFYGRTNDRFVLSFSLIYLSFSFVSSFPFLVCTACKGSSIRWPRNVEEIQASANRSFVVASDSVSPGFFRVTSTRDPTIDRQYHCQYHPI